VLHYLTLNGHVVHYRVEYLKKFLHFDQLVYVLCIDVRTNSDYFPTQLIGFICNRDKVGLLRGTDWAFK
jgi:hypothetical protein